MTMTQIPITRPVPVQRPRLWWELADSVTIAKRNLRSIPRNPELLIDVTIQPILFVLLFRYVFGGAITGVGDSYVNYLMAGIFVMTAVFGAVTTGIGLAEDLQKGLIDRFRSLPMGRASVMIGRALFDLLRSLLAIAIMLLVGLLVGFSPSGSVVQWAAGLGLLILFTFAVSWVGIVVALLLARNPVAVQAVLFIAIFPLTFASGAFVPTATMPEWLQGFAANQPVSLLVTSLRGFI